MAELTPTKGRRRTVQIEQIKESRIRRRSTQINPNREFVCNIQNTIQRLLDQEDTTKDSTITVDDQGPKRYLIEMNQGNETWLEGNYSISTLLQELALADINLKTVIVPETILNEHTINRLTRLIKTCFWRNLRRVLDANGLKLALIDTKISRVEFFLYVPSFDTEAISYYKDIISALREAGFSVTMVKIRTSKDIASGVYFSDTLGSREVLSNRSPGLLSLSLTYFYLSPVCPGQIKDTAQDKSQIKDTTQNKIDSASICKDTWHNPILGPEERNGYIARGVGPCPFYVPGGRFNEMYGWDSYFIAKGLIMSGMVAEAFCVAENLRYQIEAYGKILNANRTYYLFRGNPPLFSTLIMELYDQVSKSPEEKASLEDWFKTATDAMIKEYYYFHRGYSTELGLTKHTPGGKGIPTETEEGHFFSIIRKVVKGASSWTVSELNGYIDRYNRGEEVSEELDEYLRNDKAVRESGHDTSKRLDGVAAHLYTVDLNSLLYKTEQDILKMRDMPEIRDISEKRKESINTILWNGSAYYDYNEKTKELSTYKGATTVYPLFAGAADKDKAEVLVKGIDDLIGAGGLFTGTEHSCKLDIDSDEIQRQWDHPYGWAPHQIICWMGLVNYGYKPLAQSLALKWCTMIGRIFARYNGVVTEKYNLEKTTHKVTVEYGNIGTDIRYVPREGFGWTNSSWLIGLSLLEEKGRRELYARIILE